MNLDPKRTAFLFPGQGSQEIGMGQALAGAYPIARVTFVQADMILAEALAGNSLFDIAWEGPERLLNDTINTQPALLAHSVATIRVFTEKYPEFRPAFVAGHSMGELSALVAAGVSPYADMLQLARRRGELMKAAGENSPGGMVAVLGLDLDAVEAICSEAARQDEIVQVANDNCPGQVVVSGHGAALRRFLPLAKAKAKKVVPLMVSIAAHSPLMSQAQENFNEAVDGTYMVDPHTPIIGNVSARPMKRVRDIEDDLKAQLTSRVRWTESIGYMIEHGVDTFVEIGTGNVLTSMVKRIDRKSRRLKLGVPEDFEQLQ